MHAMLCVSIMSYLLLLGICGICGIICGVICALLLLLWVHQEETKRCERIHHGDGQKGGHEQFFRRLCDSCDDILQRLRQIYCFKHQQRPEKRREHNPQDRNDQHYGVPDQIAVRAPCSVAQAHQPDKYTVFTTWQ